MGNRKQKLPVEILTALLFGHLLVAKVVYSFIFYLAFASLKPVNILVKPDMEFLWTSC